MGGTLGRGAIARLGRFAQNEGLLITGGIRQPRLLRPTSEADESWLAEKSNEGPRNDKDDM